MVLNSKQFNFDFLFFFSFFPCIIFFFLCFQQNDIKLEETRQSCIPISSVMLNELKILCKWQHVSFYLSPTGKILINFVSSKKTNKFPTWPQDKNKLEEKKRNKMKKNGTLYMIIFFRQKKIMRRERKRENQQQRQRKVVSSICKRI